MYTWITIPWPTLDYTVTWGQDIDSIMVNSCVTEQMNFMVEEM